MQSGDKHTKYSRFYQHFQDFAKDYPKYRRKFKYFRKDVVNYHNFFLNDNNSILAIGCGIGDLLSQLKGKDKVGIDYSENMIEVAKTSHPDIEFHCMDARDITLDKKFDIIIMADVIGYMDDVQAVFEQVRKVSHRRTKLIITHYNFLWEPVLKFWEFLGVKKRTPKQNWLSHHDINNLLYLSDFETYRLKKRILIPVWLPVVSWFYNKFMAHLPGMSHFCLNRHIFARPLPTPNEEHYSSSIIIPARNESGNIEDAILRLPKFGSHQEIIFIEGNSTDDTWEKIQEIKAKYDATHDIKIGQQDGKGKGDAVRKGYNIATGDILFILDADLTVPPEDLPKFYDALQSGKGDFINGARLVYPMEKKAMRFLNSLGNKFFSLAFSWLLEQPTKDTLCGTKVLFKDDYLQLADNRSYFGDFDPFGDFDLLFGAFKLNLKIIDLPIRYRERLYGDTNISRFKHGAILLRMWFYACRKIKFK